LKIAFSERPRFASNEKVLCAKENVRKKAMAALEEFYAAYKNAMENFVDKEEYSFPHGTLKMRVQFNVTVDRPQLLDPFAFK